MPKIDRVLLFEFTPEGPKPEINITVPTGTKFLYASGYSDGIYLYVKTSSLQDVGVETHKFCFLPASKEMPAGTEYFDNVELNTEQGVMVMHVLKFTS